MAEEGGRLALATSHTSISVPRETKPQDTFHVDCQSDWEKEPAKALERKNYR